MAETEKTNAAVSKFARMSVEELEEAIRVYLQADALDENMDDLLLAADELQRRKEALGDHIDTDAHWERFKRDYLPLLDEADEEGDAENDCTSIKIETPKVSKPDGGKRIALRVFHTVAAAALIALILGMTACAVIPKVRASIISFVIRVAGNHTAIYTESTESDSPSTDSENDSGFSFVRYDADGIVFEVPNNMEMVSKSGSDDFITYYFQNDYSSLGINILDQTNGFLELDTEESLSEQIKVGEYDALLIKKGTRISLSWRDSGLEKVLILTAEQLDEETIMYIAGSFSATD